MTKQSLILAFSLSLVFTPENAFASNDIDAAKAALERGKKAFEEELFTEAAQAFREAYEKKPAWKILYNIGQCDVAAKRYGLALEVFERYLAIGGDDIVEDRRDEVLEEVSRLRKMVGSLDVKAPDNAVVFVDELKRGTTPLPGPLQVAAGLEHRVVIETAEEVLLDRVVLVSGEKTIIVEVKEQTETGGKKKVSDESDSSPSSTLKTVGWVTLGFGGAVLIGSGVTGGLALSARSEVNDKCDAGCSPENYDLLDKRDNLALTTDVLIGVGAAAAIAGVVMLIVDAKGEKSDSQVVIAPKPGGLSVVGRF